jgi:hypothetical protein
VEVAGSYEGLHHANTNRGARRVGLPLLRPHPLSKPEDGPVSRYMNRYISAWISRALLRTNVTPN